MLGSNQRPKGGWHFGNTFFEKLSQCFLSVANSCVKKLGPNSVWFVSYGYVEDFWNDSFFCYVSKVVSHRSIVYCLTRRVRDSLSVLPNDSSNLATLFFKEHIYLRRICFCFFNILYYILYIVRIRVKVMIENGCCS